VVSTSMRLQMWLRLSCLSNLSCVCNHIRETAQLSGAAAAAIRTAGARSCFNYSKWDGLFRLVKRVFNCVHVTATKHSITQRIRYKNVTVIKCSCTQRSRHKNVKVLKRKHQVTLITVTSI
jgi:hypothetical protein